MLPRPSPTAAWFDHKARNANALRKSGGRRLDEPQHGEPFNDPSSVHVWEDYQCAPDFSNPDQAKVDIGQRNRLWYYLPKTSTESKAHYTDDPQNPQPNVQAHPFPNDLLQANRPKATMSARTLPIPRASIALSNPVTPKTPKPPPPAPIPIKVSESPNNRNPKPYIYKPKEPVKPELKHTASGSPTTAQQNHGPGVPTLTAQLPPPDPPKPCAPGPIERWLNAPLPSSKAERDASSENYLRRFPLSLDNNNHLTSGDGHSIGFGHQSMNHVMNNATLMDHGLMHTGNYQAHHRNTSTLSLPPKKLIQHARKTKSARHDQKVAIDRLDRLIAGNPGHDGRMANHQPSLSMGVMSGMGSLEQMAHIAPIAPVAPMAPMAPMLKINNQWNLDEGNIPSPGSAAHRFLNLDGTSGGGTPTPSHPGTTKRMSVSEKSDNGAFDPPSPDQADSPEGVEFDDSLNDVFDPFQEGALFRSHESDCYKSLYRSGGGFTEAAPACRR